MKSFGVNKISIFYNYFQWLSFDVALGAVISQQLFYRIFGSEPVLGSSISLVLAVLFIYNADHWIDSRQSQGLNPRRIFYRRYSARILSFCTLLLALGVASLFFLPTTILYTGGLFSLLCLAYLFLVYFFPGTWFKELLVAACYATGVVIAPFLLRSSTESYSFFIVCQFAGMALVNLLLFSYFDVDGDREAGFSSFVLQYGRQATEGIIMGLITLLFFSEFALLFLYPNLLSVQLIFLLMTLVLLAIYVGRSYFSKNEYYRIAGDAIFFLPGILLL